MEIDEKALVFCDGGIARGGKKKTDLKRVKGREPELLCYCSLVQKPGDYF